MAEEFVEIIKKCSTISLDEKINIIIDSMGRIMDIFIKKIENLENEILILKAGQINNTKLENDNIYNAETDKVKKTRRELPKIPSKVSGKDLGHDITREIGNENVRGALMNELKMLFRKRNEHGY